MSYIKKLVPILIMLILVSCKGDNSVSSMDISWQTPEDWGFEEKGQNPEGSFVHVDYYFLDNSLNDFVSQRFLFKFLMNKHMEEEIALFRERMFDDQFVYTEKSTEYYIEVCKQDALVLERLYRPNKGGVSGSYDAYAINIWFTVDRTLYSISLWSNERDKEISKVRIEQFWNMIETIECPSD